MLYVTCKNCGFNYSSGIRVRNSVNVTISDHHTICPRCNRPNNSNFGTADYDEDGKVVKRYLDDAKLTKSEAIQLADLINRASIGVPKKEELIVKAEKIKKGLGNIFNIKSLDTKELIALMTLILLVLKTFGFLPSEKPTTIINNNVTNHYNVSGESFGKDFERILRQKNLEKLQNSKTKKGPKKPLRK